MEKTKKGYMITNITFKDLKDIFACSKKFVMDQEDPEYFAPSVTVAWLDQNKIGYYDDGGHADSPLWDKAETKQFKSIGSAWNFAKTKYNGKNIVDCDLDVYIPLAEITYDNFGLFGLVPTRNKFNLRYFATLHAYDEDLVVTTKEIVNEFDENYKFTFHKHYNFVN